MSTSGISIKPRVALIAGPTASGKSDLAVDLALASAAAGLPARVINADSAQVYADLQVLSARPTEDEMRGVPHRLFGEWDGATACSAADWAARAKAEIDAAHAALALPILVGGTGLYLRTLIEGIAPIPPIDPAIRAEVRAMPVAEAHRALAALDPEAAARLNPSDTTRVARALEVLRSTGTPLKQWQARREGGIGDGIMLSPAILLPDRARLYRKCDDRFARMLDSGAVEEVRTLLARNLDPALPVMRAIGVPEIAGMLRGEWNREEAMARGSQATRRYAKRQYTWFRHQPPAGWARYELENIVRKSILESLLQSLVLT